MKKLLLLFALPLLLLNACKKENKFEKVDISNIQINQKLYRFDKELFSISPDSLQDKVPYLIKKYDGFLELFSNQIIRIGSPYEKDFAERLNAFVTDYVVRKTYEYSEKKFSDFTPIYNDINKAFRYYKYYFPDKNIPDIYTFISGFNIAIATDSNLLGIGLDFYLGKDFEFYPQLALPNYIIRKMEPYMILPDAMRGWLSMEFPPDDSVNTLLANMIYGGKIQYLMEAILPFVDDTVKFCYTKEQLEWCKENEEPMWTYLVDKKLLYKTDRLIIKKFVDEAPFTVPFGRKSPPKTGIWIGYRIVSRFMEKHPEITLQQLMAEKNYQKILVMSAYRPK
jgi:gliding motility-associated lipoprotein GldB